MVLDVPWLAALHVVTAGLVLGALATLVPLRSRLEGHEDSRTTGLGLEHARIIEEWILMPAIGVLLVLGLRIVEGSAFARMDLAQPGPAWLNLVAILWFLLGVSVSLMRFARGRLRDEADRGATGGSRVRSWWRWWMTGCLTSALVALGGLIVLVARLGA